MIKILSILKVITSVFTVRAIEIGKIDVINKQLRQEKLKRRWMLSQYHLKRRKS